MFSQFFPKTLSQLAFIWICSHNSMANAMDMTNAINLQHEAELANSQGKPLILLYSRHHCHFCEIVRRDYLQPLENKSTEHDKFVIRQINIDRDTPLVDFAGKLTSHSRFATQHKIKLVPVVAFYNLNGQNLSDPIVGARIPDFYQSYLDDAIKKSIAQLPQKQSSP